VPQESTYFLVFFFSSRICHLTGSHSRCCWHRWLWERFHFYVVPRLEKDSKLW